MEYIGMWGLVFFGKYINLFTWGGGLIVNVSLKKPSVQWIFMFFVAKGGFLSENEIHFSNLPKKLFQETILSLKFE